MDAGHRAIIFNSITGLKPSIKTEGTKFLIPWLEKPIIYDCRASPRIISSPTGSKGNQIISFNFQDLQKVDVTLRILSRPDQRFLLEIHRQFGKDYDERVLPGIVNEVLKSVVVY